MGFVIETKNGYQLEIKVRKHREDDARHTNFVDLTKAQQDAIDIEVCRVLETKEKKESKDPADGK